MTTEMRETRVADSVISEIDQEAVITKRLLDVIPEDKLAWRPHPKAKSLGELAMHIATLQGNVAELADLDSKEAGDFPPDVLPATRAEILAAFDESTQKAKAIVGRTDNARASSDWKLVRNGEAILTVQRSGFWRSILLNHNYHHRGQLSAYLRELDVELPSIYGPSADTDPFA